MRSFVRSTTVDYVIASPASNAADDEENAATVPPPRLDELIGRTLNGTYIVEAVIGEGGVGKVYRARHARIHTKVFALKVLHAEHGRDPQQLARFQREAEAAATLSHPKVVGVYDVGRTSDGYSYLACEFLDGTDLDAYLDQKGKLDVETAVRLAIQICEALESAHAQNIVHRDLKPQNVFLLNGPDGRLPEHPDIKLVDFGLSRFLDHSDAQLTKTGSLLGTPTYMAPEQATGERGDHRVDVYGVGVILYAALTGRPPFVEETLPAMLVAVMTEEAPRPRTLVPDIPETLELVIQRAMSKQANNRYPNITELKEALFSILPKEETKTLHQTRPRMSSALSAVEETYELRTSRPRLVFYWLVAVWAGIACLTSAVSGLELFTGPFQFSDTELILVLLGICGTIATPAILGLRHFRSMIWSNSAKVVDALARMRAPLTAALVAYGIAAISVRFADEFFGRLQVHPIFVPQPGLGWAGFSWVLPIVALIAASGAHLKRRLQDSPRAAGHMVWLGAPLLGLTLLLCAAVLFGGMKWRAHDVATRHLEALPTAPAVAAVPSAPSALPKLSLPAPVPPEEPVPLANDTELAEALGQGVEGLLPLSEKYPRDPRVLEPLLIEFATRATGLADAMVTASRLVAIAPEKRSSETLGLLVRRAAATPGNASDRAFELMTKELGSTGPDLLYQLARGNTKVSERASLALRSASAQKLMSPALRVTLELEAADSCEARLPLLHRAKHLGDVRAANVLAPLSKGTKTGCGQWKNRPCSAPCKDQAKEYLEVVYAIQARETGTSSL